MEIIIDMINRVTMNAHGVTLPRQAIIDALATDLVTAGRHPLENECVQMLAGAEDDEDVEAPAAVKLLFPRTTEELESAWQLK